MADETIKQCFCTEPQYTIKLNQQGPSGRQGAPGEPGFTPEISVAVDTPDTYKLNILNATDQIQTPNLKAVLAPGGVEGNVLTKGSDSVGATWQPLPQATQVSKGIARLATENDFIPDTFGDINDDAIVTPNLVVEKIKVETDRATGAEANLQTQITNEVNRATNVETTLRTDVDDLLDEISTKQNNLVAGENITLVNNPDNTTTISSTGGIVEIPQATETTLGGIKASPKTDSETSEVKIDTATGKLYAQVGSGGASTVVDYVAGTNISIVPTGGRLIPDANEFTANERPGLYKLVLIQPGQYVREPFTFFQAEQWSGMIKNGSYIFSYEKLSDDSWTATPKFIHIPWVNYGNIDLASAEITVTYDDASTQTFTQTYNPNAGSSIRIDYYLIFNPAKTFKSFTLKFQCSTYGSTSDQNRIGPLTFNECSLKTINNTYTVPRATNSNLGGIKANNKTSTENNEVKIDPNTGILYSSAGAIPSNMVTTDTEQSITGYKYFNAGIGINGSTGIKDNNNKTFIQTSQIESNWRWVLGNNDPGNFAEIMTRRGASGLYVNVDSGNVGQYITSNADIQELGNEVNTLSQSVSNNTTALNGLKLWKGTQSEYDAIATKDNNTIYIIT